MNKKTFFIILGIAALIFVVFLVAQLSTGEPTVEGPTVGEPVDGEPYQEPYIKGEIVSMSEKEVLIAEDVEGEYDGDIGKLKGNAVWFTIGEEAKITGLEGEVFSFGDLEVGQKIEAWSTGLILESYPARGTAVKIKLIQESQKEESEEKKEALKKCFIGGCSGELCTDDPEAISICEILPGMECLAEEMSCQLVEGECEWILSGEAAVCFLAVKEERGEQVTESRIGYLFKKAGDFLSQ